MAIPRWLPHFGRPVDRSEPATAQPTKRLTRPSRILAIVGLVIAVGAAWLGYQVWQASAAPAALTGSGTLEADETLVSPKVSGTITALPLAEGSNVSTGTVVAQIDDRLVQIQIQEADVANRRLLELQQQDYVLRAPTSGVITRLPARIGEMAMPGAVILAIANLDRLKLTLYVREAELARVSVGQQLIVTADPFPGRSFRGQVTSINQQAEFTPRNVQTQSDRLNLVFGVQATVDNPDGALKPGMPVDASFTSGRGS